MLRRLAALVLLVACEAEALPRMGGALPRGCRDRGCVRSRTVGAETPPAFEFAPASGAGMTAPCACTMPTGSTGETMTFVRATTATCLKGNVTTGVSVGDMVTCSSGQPRVMRGGDGSGVLGLQVESTRQNNAVYSEAFDNAAWLKINSVAAAPVVTADQALSPLNTLTAERVQFASSSGAQYSLLYNATNCPANGASASVWVKGCHGIPDGGCSALADGGTDPAYDGGVTKGVLVLGIDDGAAVQTEACTYTSSSWTRCKKEDVSRGVATGMAIGNGSVYTGVSYAANDVFLWGADCENGAHITSYIATAGVSATRNIDTATFSIAWPLPSFSSSEVVMSNRALSDNWVPYQMFFAGPGSFWQTYSASGGQQTLYFSATTNTVDSTGVLSLGLPNSVRSYATGATVASCVNGSCGSEAAADVVGGGTGTLYLGRNTATTNAVDGTVAQFCLDPSPGKCGDVAQPASVTWLGDSLSAFGTPSAPTLYQRGFHKRVSSGATSGAPFNYAATPVGSSPGCRQQWDVVTQTGKVVLFCGINTFLLSAQTAAALWTDYQSFIDARVAEGRRVTVVTLSPCGGHADCSAGVKTKITTFNASLLAWCAANPTQGCVDLYSLMNDGTGALWAAYDSGDHVHFTALGYQLLANAVGVAVGP